MNPFEVVGFQYGYTQSNCMSVVFCRLLSVYYIFVIPACPVFSVSEETKAIKILRRFTRARIQWQCDSMTASVWYELSHVVKLNKPKRRDDKISDKLKKNGKVLNIFLKTR